MKENNNILSDIVSYIIPSIILILILFGTLHYQTSKCSDNGGEFRVYVGCVDPEMFR